MVKQAQREKGNQQIQQEETDVLVFRLMNSRRKAKKSAVFEVMSLLIQLGAREIPNGPLGLQGGLFYVGLPHDSLEAGIRLFPRLGYTASVERVEFIHDDSHKNLPRWKGRHYMLSPIYEVDRAVIRDSSPDRREFYLPNRAGGVRKVVGYRGDSAALSRRGLAVEDARLLVNAVYRAMELRFLDPFAGAGGVVHEALRNNYQTFSVDSDPFLMYGLHKLGSFHAVGDARHLPFRSGAFDAIASEPPYDQAATEIICRSITEMDRILKPMGRVALMVADPQAEAVLHAAEMMSWQPLLYEQIDRKGLPVTVLCWQKQ